MQALSPWIFYLCPIKKVYFSLAKQELKRDVDRDSAQRERKMAIG